MSGEKKQKKTKRLQLEVVHYHCFLCLDKKPQKFQMSNAKTIQLQKTQLIRATFKWIQNKLG